MAEPIRKKMDMTKLDESYRLKLEWIKEQCAGGEFDEMDQENFEGTDLRSSKAFAEMCRSKEEIKDNCKSFLKTFKIKGEDKELGMITQGPIKAIGLCPHHLLPVEMTVYVSYLPSNKEDAKVLGLSKLTRLAQEISKYPMLQESYAKNLADVLYKGNDWLEGVNSLGCAVQVIGSHGCMKCRGVRSDSLTSTVETRGTYKDDREMEDRFYQQVQAIERRSHGF